MLDQFVSLVRVNKRQRRVWNLFVNLEMVINNSNNNIKEVHKKTKKIVVKQQHFINNK